MLDRSLVGYETGARLLSRRLFSIGASVLAQLLSRCKDEIDRRQRPGQTNGSVMSFLQSEGEMARHFSRFDWSRHPLGPLDAWPQSLKTAASLILNSRHPMWIGWGPQMSFLYNDAYLHVLGLEKHPWALGRPADEVWAEIWDVCGPLADKVFRDGEASFVDEVRLLMSRGDVLEETFYSFSYSPIVTNPAPSPGSSAPRTTSRRKRSARAVRARSPDWLRTR